MKFEFIRNNEAHFGIDEMCAALEVSRSGYYAWQEGRLSARSVADQAVKEAIKDVFKKIAGPLWVSADFQSFKGRWSRLWPRSDFAPDA